jgi:hypothetical protein
LLHLMKADFPIAVTPFGMRLVCIPTINFPEFLSITQLS